MSVNSDYLNDNHYCHHAGSTGRYLTWVQKGETEQNTVSRKINMWGAGSYVKRNYETTVDGIKQLKDYL